MEQTMNYLFTKEIKEKIQLLDDFGITKELIPNGFFAGIRSQRDLDLRAQGLISKRLVIAEYENKED